MKGPVRKTNSHGVQAAGSVDKMCLFSFTECFAQCPDGTGYNCFVGQKDVFTGNPDEVVKYMRDNNIKAYQDASFIILPKELQE